MKFWLGLLAAVLLIAGGVSYLASSHPDGLDAATLRGCSVAQTDSGEELTGSCVAQHATDPATAGSPLAGYAVASADGTVGVAGVLGAAVTLVVAGGLFWAISRKAPR